MSKTLDGDCSKSSVLGTCPDLIRQALHVSEMRHTWGGRPGSTWGNPGGTVVLPRHEVWRGP